MDYVTRLAAGMHLVEPRHVLCADHVMEEWDPELVGCREGVKYPLPNWFLCLDLNNVSSAPFARTRSSASCRTCGLMGRAAATG